MSEADQVQTTYKFVVVLNKSIETGVALNACAHMVAGLVARADEATRQQMNFIDYVDADNNVHTVSGLSLIVLSAKNSNQIRTARAAVVENKIPFVDFTESMTKDTYIEQMDRTRHLHEQDLDYWGLAMFGPKVDLDPITRKFSLWRSY
jgi:hypothetical protein